METKLEVLFRLNSYFNALDEKRFSDCLDCFEPLFDADYTSLVGGNAFTDLPREVNLGAWNGMIAGFTSTHHLVGNHEIKVIDEKHCEVKAKVTATHSIKRENNQDDLWVIGGDYFIDLIKADDDLWRIKKIKFVKAWGNGNISLMQEATTICEERNRNKAT